MIFWLSYLHNGITYTGKISSHWIRSLVTITMSLYVYSTQTCWKFHGLNQTELSLPSFPIIFNAQRTTHRYINWIWTNTIPGNWGGGGGGGGGGILLIAMLQHKIMGMCLKGSLNFSPQSFKYVYLEFEIQMHVEKRLKLVLIFQPFWCLN